MSIRALNWAFAQDLKNSNHKFVLVALADSADDYGICWPSYNTIAKKCSVHRVTAIKAINSLMELGLLSKKARYKSQGQNSNAFQLKMGVKISDDHPLKDLVAEDYPLVAEDYPPSSQALPKSTTEPLKEKKALTRNEFLREVDKGYKSDAFKDWPHLTETEIFNAAEACLDFFGAKGEWPAGQPVPVLRHWIRGGIQRGTIRKTDKPETGFQESKPKEPENKMQPWHEKARVVMQDDAQFRSWIRPLHWDGNGHVIAPSAFMADHVRIAYGDLLAMVIHSDIQIIDEKGRGHA